MTTEDNTGNVTPEWLIEHGFVQYKSSEEPGIHDTPFHNEDDQHFIEKNFDRNMFVVILSPYDENKFDHSIYVQDDVGCGFTLIPERWSELAVEHLQAIYYGIRGKYLQPTKK